MTDPIVEGIKADLARATAAARGELTKIEAAPKSLWARFVAWIKSKL